MSADIIAIENRLWAAADQLWANSGLKPSEFSVDRKNKNLRQTRNLLLPKLISGGVNLCDLDKYEEERL